MEDRPEEMASFFDARAEGYDAHMYDFVGEEMYRSAASFLPCGEEALAVLDLGCGTGIELPFLWERLPNARVTGVDLSGEMLSRLEARCQKQRDRLRLVQASYLEWEYPEAAFDLVISCQTMHHFERDAKRGLYRRILRTLRPGGFYLETDFMVGAEQMASYWEEYKRLKEEDVPPGYYHLDIPMTVEMQKELFREAGFRVEVCREHLCEEGSYAILRGTKAG